MSQSLSLFVSTLALSATTAVSQGGHHHHHHHHHAHCPKETIIDTSCKGIKIENLVCLTPTSDVSSAVECNGDVWVEHNGLVGEAFSDPPAAAPAPPGTTGPARIMTLPPTNDRYLSQVYARDMEDDSAAAAAAGGFIGSSFVGFAVTVGVVALL